MEFLTFLGVIAVTQLVEVCVGIKAVYNVVIRCIFWGLNRQIRRASAAKNQHVDLILHMLQLRSFQHLYACSAYLYVFRISSGKYSDQLHILIMGDCALYASAQVSVS